MAIRDGQQPVLYRGVLLLEILNGGCRFTGEGMMVDLLRFGRDGFASGRDRIQERQEPAKGGERPLPS